MDLKTKVPGRGYFMRYHRFGELLLARCTVSHYTALVTSE